MNSPSLLTFLIIFSDLFLHQKFAQKYVVNFWNFIWIYTFLTNKNSWYNALVYIIYTWLYMFTSSCSHAIHILIYYWLGLMLLSRTALQSTGITSFFERSIFLLKCREKHFFHSAPQQSVSIWNKREMLMWVVKVL